METQKVEINIKSQMRQISLKTNFWGILLYHEKISYFRFEVTCPVYFWNCYYINFYEKQGLQKKSECCTLFLF